MFGRILTGKDQEPKMVKVGKGCNYLLETKRIKFREFKSTDLIDFNEYASDDEVTRYLTWNSHTDLEHSQRVLNNFYVGNNNCLALVNKEDNKCIGSITVTQQELEESVSIGLVLNKSFWNKGIGTEVMKYTINRSFETLCIERVRAEHFIGNQVSAKMMQNTGMKHIGGGNINGRETEIYEINKEEWKHQNYKVLFINPPTVSEIPQFARGISYYSWLKTKGKFYAFVPGELLGAQCIQKYVQMENKNCIFQILNGCVEEHISVEQTFEEIKKMMPIDLLCIGGPYDVFSEVLYLANKVKESSPNTKILCGQFFASLCYEDILKKYDVFDYLCVGYGEIAVSKLINCLQGQGNISDVPGIAYRDGDSVIYNASTSCYMDEIIKITPTRDSIEKVMETGLNVSIFASRGCPYHCSFCASGSLMGRYRGYALRNPYEVVDELETLYNLYHIEKITFVDDTFAPNTAQGKEQARIIAEEIIKRDIKISIMIDTRIDCIDRDLFTLLYQAGVRYAYLGIEAASNDNLKEYNKGYKANVIVENLKILKEIGITPVYGFINFNPETSFEDLQKNVAFLQEIKNVDPTLLSHEFIPYPGTDMTNRLLKEGLVVGEFPDYKLKYKDLKIYEVKKNYDFLLLKFTAFLLKMNQYPDFYINTYEDINNGINEVFTEYFGHLIEEIRDGYEYEHLKDEYEIRLKKLLKQILVKEREKGTI